MTSWYEMNVKMVHILTGRGAAGHDQIHGVGARNLPNDGAQVHCNLKEMHPYVMRKIYKRLIVLPRHHQSVAGIHRLNVHESKRRGVLVTDGHLSGAAYYVAEGTVGSSR